MFINFRPRVTSFLEILVAAKQRQRLTTPLSSQQLPVSHGETQIDPDKEMGENTRLFNGFYDALKIGRSQRLSLFESSYIKKT